MADLVPPQQPRPVQPQQAEPVPTQAAPQPATPSDSQTLASEESALPGQGLRHERIRVLVETAERSFRGYIYKPVKDAHYRLSDHLNEYEHNFIALADVIVQDRGQAYRAGDRRDFIAVAISAITYITPLREDEP
jgi:hypothetical protein